MQADNGGLLLNSGTRSEEEAAAQTGPASGGIPE
jgi:hypothetical protein